MRLTLADAPQSNWRIAADIGGTFTDIACLGADGTLTTCKLPSTPDEYSRAIVSGIRAIAVELGVELHDFTEVLHASTIATNAILEGKGAVTALVTTEGFRDILELRRIRVPRLYEPLYQKPAPLVPRRRRHEVSERIGPRGDILKPLDEAALRDVGAQLAASGVEAVAICFLHSYVNPVHESRAAGILREMMPESFLSISHEVLPEIREYERTSTTVVNAYVGRIVKQYLSTLERSLVDHGIDGRLLMMQSSGGVLDVDRVIAKPATVIESGPAAGVVGAARLAHHAGDVDLITFDMGGTTAKSSLIKSGRLVTTDEYEVGGGISMSSALAKGGGYALKLPVINVSEVGAGGGSIVRVDRGGALKVGPESAGASPGPACYDAGGQHPTVTDANVVLGYLNPTALAGGTVPIKRQLAEHAIATQIAKPLGREVLETAYGIHCLANSAMMRAVKAVSTYRGHDPREFSLFAFGGNGGIHAASLAGDLGMKRVLIPPGAGVFSAVGLLLADFEVSHSSAWLQRLDGLDTAALGERFARLEVKVLAEIGRVERVDVRWRAALRYAGQGFELWVDVPRPIANAAALESLRDAFADTHRSAYGHAQADQAIDFVALRVTGTLPPNGGRVIHRVRQVENRRTRGDRMVYFGKKYGLVASPVIDRSELDAAQRPGPWVIEEYEGTTVVPPGTRAQLDPHGNIVIVL